ncbi:MAG: hypothetical protein K2K70_07020, partial [Lachnospiraceae bacterium]|nr:hypothetical protein [Lachnospiraceae bacterium]
MKKRLYAFMLVLAMIVSICPATPGAIAAKAETVEATEVKVRATVTPWDGSAKEEPEQVDGVYQIATAAELAWFAEYVNDLGAADTGLVAVDAVLTEDIDLGDHPWTPISMVNYVTDAYAGNFNGQNHTVSGLKIDTTSANYGLFSVVNTGTIENLKVEGDVSSSNVVGGIIGKLQNGGAIRNCSMRGSVSSTGKTTKGYAGGLIGTVTNAPGAIITGCCNQAEVSGSYAGGILGYNSNAVVISSCYNTGDITGVTRSGGIAGQQSKGTISYCYSIGTSKNGICGFSSATVTNCYYLAENTSDAVSAPGGTPSGIGYETISGKDSLLQNLNAAGSEGSFCEDTAGINEGYPVLNWQLVSDVVSIPVTEVSIIGEKKTGAGLMAQALGKEGEAATNVSYQWEQSGDGSHYTDIPSAVNRNFEIPDEAEYAGKYIR